MKHISVYVAAIIAGSIGLVSQGYAFSSGMTKTKGSGHHARRHYQHRSRTTTNDKSVSGDKVVHINKVDSSKLETLHGIGKKKAEAIISYRKQHGDFKSLDGLVKVKGISKSYLAKLLDKNPNMIAL